MRFDYEPSRKLNNYLTKIRNETGLQISIQPIRPHKPRPYGSSSGFVYDPSRIRILVFLDRPRYSSEIDEEIAHEATHGLLMHKKGYSPPSLKRDACDSENECVNWLFTMIDDIVVHRNLQKEGYSPFATLYLREIQRETHSMRRGEDYYKFLPDPLLKDIFMAFRYVTAQAYLEYFHLDPIDREIIQEFINALRERYPKQLENAYQATGIVLRNDIFGAEGRNNAMKELIKLWDLQDLVELKTGEKP